MSENKYIDLQRHVVKKQQKPKKIEALAWKNHAIIQREDCASGEKGGGREVTSASAEILVVPHTLDLILSSTYLHEFPPDFRNLQARHT